MKLYIPAIGEQLKLTADWTFDLWNESRNETIMEVLNDTRDIGYSYSKSVTILPKPATIPAGEILKVDRIYIRKGKEDFDSISFFWKDMRTKSYIEQRPITSYMGPTPVRTMRDVKMPAKPVRFWVKLEDANKIEFDLV